VKFISVVFVPDATPENIVVSVEVNALPNEFQMEDQEGVSIVELLGEPSSAPVGNIWVVAADTVPIISISNRHVVTIIRDEFI
jgi:hypothetical protein